MSQPRKYPAYVRIAIKLIRDETGLSVFDLPREEQFRIFLASLDHEHEHEYIHTAAILAAWEQMRDTRRERARRWGRNPLPK
jgi:hypothetical protein